MRTLISFLILALSLGLDARATDGGLVEAGKLYNVPTGNFDIDYTTTETLAEGQTVVVFYNTNRSIAYTSRNFAFGPGYREFSYANERDADNNLIVRFYDTREIVKAGQQLLINLFSPLEENATWTYVICQEAEKQTVKNPFAASGEDSAHDLPGQTEATAIEIGSVPVAVESPISKLTSTEYTIYARFTAPAEGRAYIDMPEGDMAHYIKAEGDTYRLFAPENGYPVQPGVTYYVWYRYTLKAVGNASVRIEEPTRGEARSTAILVSGNTVETLLGKASIGTEYYFNTTTWFRLNNEALAGQGLMTITLSGGNSGEVALIADGDTDPLKTYSLGEGTGMLPLNSTVAFDIDPASHTYYVAIMQDNVGGTATFAFSPASPGETMGSALPATVGNNTAEAGKWYKYTHEGDNLIRISNVSTVLDAHGRLVANGSDVAMGFRMAAGQTIYFQADGDFEIAVAEITEGTVADKPVILTLDQDGFGSFGFQLHGSDSDASRYVQYAATQTGTLMYGTDNTSVVEMAFGASVLDLTTRNRITVAQRVQDFGTPYFTYTFPVIAGHTYLIEQTLQNNLGEVLFMVTCTPASVGEVLEMPIAVGQQQTFDLGRKASQARYLCFIAQESGNYQLSVNAQGYVKRYLADGTSYSIQRDYAGGTEFHNETIGLNAGDSILFSVETTADIEHLAGGVQDFFIPNYYAIVNRIAEADGSCLERAKAISGNTVITNGQSPVWYGPVTIPANERLVITAADSQFGSQTALVFITNEKGQWIDNESDIQYQTQSTTHTYTLHPAAHDRVVYLVANGLRPGARWAIGDDLTAIHSTRETHKKSQIGYNLLGQPSNGKGLVITDGRKKLVK